jgi:hypothetical protein
LAGIPSISRAVRYDVDVGSFYANVTVRGPVVDQVVAAVQELGYHALVATTVKDLTVICEEQSDTQDKSVWQRVASRLSEKLSCDALAVMNRDDDILLYALYRSGRLADEYNSCPAYWNEADPNGEAGGNPSALCKAFGMPGDPTEVDRVLHTAITCKDDDSDDFVFAGERHAALISALGWPDVPYQQGFDYLTKQRLDSQWRVVG